ncbi:hypothetical protein [Methylibium sp.]|uniref:hypothetical protein n=1 Tax=Methylibium sp. TaxID=2067992 RepID=UPI00286BAA03|nr:hypothetical protein [Methylibium sp.]
MRKDGDAALRRAVRHYGIGLAAVAAGAAAMSWTGSMVPLALAGSAAIMLTVPLLQQLRLRAARRRSAERSP